MEFSKLQTIALVILTTILTDKFIVNHNYNNPTVAKPTPTPTIEISPIPTGVSQNEIILKEIQNLRKDMVTAKQAIPTSGSSLISGMVQINSEQWSKIDVYEKAVSSSKIKGSIKYGTIYFYHQKTNDWYEIYLDDGQSGWVRAQFLEEIE